MAPRAIRTTRRLRLPRERIGAHLEFHDLGGRAFAAFHVEGRAVASVRPDAAALPASIGIVDAAVKSLGPEAHRIGDDHVDHLAVLERDQRVVLVAGGERHVLAEAKRVVLIDPGVVGRLATAVISDAAELRSRQWIERPAFGAMLAGRVRAVERAFALAAVERPEMPAGERGPRAASTVDVATARRVTRPRARVDFRERRFRPVRPGVD